MIRTQSVQVSYEPETNMAYVQIAQGQVHQTVGVGIYQLDLAEDGSLVGIEVFGATRNLPQRWTESGDG
jgi:uncharacterized protein YuzE